MLCQQVERVRVSIQNDEITMVDRLRRPAGSTVADSTTVTGCSVTSLNDDVTTKTRLDEGSTTIIKDHQSAVAAEAGRRSICPRCEMEFDVDRDGGMAAFEIHWKRCLDVYF